MTRTFPSHVLKPFERVQMGKLEGDPRGIRGGSAWDPRGIRGLSGGSATKTHGSRLGFGGIRVRPPTPFIILNWEMDYSGVSFRSEWEVWGKGKMAVVVSRNFIGAVSVLG